MIKPWQPHARHILDGIAQIRRSQARGDLMQYDATRRNLQTLEATQPLPDELQQRHPVVPRRQISGFRNIPTQACRGEIDPLTVSGVVEKHLARLEHAARSMLPETGV